MVTLDQAGWGGRMDLVTSRALLFAIVSSVAAVPALAQPPARADADTRLFSMQSNFRVNLYHWGLPPPRCHA